jgi:preprotein translocase subunit SecD
MRRRLYITFACILALFALAGYISWPNTNSINLFGKYKDISLRKGLDLQGGVHLAYEADLSSIAPSQQAQTMESLRENIEQRANGGLGVTEPDIRTTTINGKPGINIDLPGQQDVQQAKDLLGSTAKLEFKDANGNVVLEGKDLDPNGIAAQIGTGSSSATSSSSLGQSWEVNVTMTSEGKAKFAKATTNNVGKQLSIYLDNKLISAPTVQEAITDGTAVINGTFTAQEAKDFAKKLKFGALPVPISLVQEQAVGASLGSDAIHKSILAGLVGIILVGIFMIAYYHWLGVIALLSLVFYALVNIALYKLIPVTITLAGLAGFIISMGIAVDTNILTFERLKEELRLGKPIAVAVQESFKRAWTSIRDSHISGIISALIIFNIGSSSVRGFALILLIGTCLSLFSAITVTRNWMLLVAGSKLNKILHP